MQWAAITKIVFDTADLDVIRNQPKLECAVRDELGSLWIRLEEPPVAGAARRAEVGLVP